MAELCNLYVAMGFLPVAIVTNNGRARLLAPRRWLRGRKNKLSREKRKTFNVPVVKKTKRRDGTTAVSAPKLSNTAVC